jgi:hypothetical protein
LIVLIVSEPFRHQLPGTLWCPLDQTDLSP